jgi:hypothetical protein
VASVYRESTHRVGLSGTSATRVAGLQTGHTRLRCEAQAELSADRRIAPQDLQRAADAHAALTQTERDSRRLPAVRSATVTGWRCATAAEHQTRQARAFDSLRPNQNAPCEPVKVDGDVNTLASGTCAVLLLLVVVKSANFPLLRPVQVGESGLRSLRNRHTDERCKPRRERRPCATTRATIDGTGSSELSLVAAGLPLAFDRCGAAAGGLDSTSRVRCKQRGNNNHAKGAGVQSDGDQSPKRVCLMDSSGGCHLRHWRIQGEQSSRDPERC